MNRSLIELFADRYPFDYPEPEVIMTLHKAGMRLEEIPVSMKPRTTGVSSISWTRSVYYMCKVTFAIWVEKFRVRTAVPL